MSQLTVWNEGAQLGELSLAQGRWQFSYHPLWLQNAQAFVLSPHFPLQADTFIDTADNKSVEWFFENLLPEGGMREALARKARLSEKDSFGLLSRYGEETAGALSLLPANTAYPENGHYQKLSHKEIRTQINKTASSLLTANEQLHMSLAGVQNKLGILYKDNQFFLPEGSAASSHILKPENNNAEFIFCPANEFFCMQLANALGLNVANTRLLHIPDALYLIERFDRSIKAGSIKRKHQIDLCQLLNKWVGYKYESHAGISSQNLFTALNQLTQPAIAKDHVIRWMIFNYLIGNNDAHAKNISFMLSANSISVAPFYDLLCVEAYLPDSLMAMSIAEENKAGWIEKEHWLKLANEAGVSEVLILQYLHKMGTKIEIAANKLLLLDVFTDAEKQFLESKVLSVIKQRFGFLDGFI